MIFDAETATSEVDKTSAKPAYTHRWIVRFGAASHGGAYDLILAPAHFASSRRFTWSGSAYRPADAPAVRPR